MKIYVPNSKFLSHSANDLYWFVVPLILPRILAMYDLSYTAAGAILTWYFAVTGIGSYVLGLAADKYSPYKSIGLGFIVASMSLSLFGLTDSFLLSLSLLTFLAMGMSTFHPTMYALIDHDFTENEHNKGRFLGMYETYGTAAILIMFLLYGTLVSVLGYTGLLLLLSIPGFIFGIYFLYNEGKHVSKDIRPKIKPVQNIKTQRTAMQNPSMRKKRIRLLIGIILRILSVSSILNFLPLICMNLFKLDESAAAMMTAIFFLGGIPGSLAGGFLAQKYSSRKVLMLSTGITGLAILPLSIIQMPHIFHFATIGIMGFSASLCFIQQNLYVSSLSETIGKGEIFGLLMAIMTLASAVSPSLLGLSIDSLGFTTAIKIFSIPPILGAAMLITKKRI